VVGNDAQTINLSTATLNVKNLLKQAGAPAAAKTTEKAEWKVLTGEQEEYGPVTKTDLDGWVADGRLDKECQLLKDGWDQWKWADEVYPELANGQAAAAPTPPGGPAISTAPAAAPAGANPFAGLGGVTKSPPPAPSAPAFPSPGGPPSFAPAAPVNPYVSPPGAGAAGAGAGAMTGEIAAGVLTALRNTQLWVLIFVILSVLSFLGAAGGAIVNLVALLPFVGPQAVLVLLGFAPSIVLTGVFCWLLYSYYAALGEVSSRPTIANLQKAMEAQQRFWMVSGITVIVSVLLTALLAFVIMAVITAAIAAGARAAGGPPPNFP
jgi:hypothetical protein